MLFEDLIQDSPFTDTKKYSTEFTEIANELTRLHQENLKLHFEIACLNSELTYAKRVADINSKVYSFI